MNHDIIVRVGADTTELSRKLSNSAQKIANFGKANQKTFAAFGKMGDVLTKGITLPAVAATTALTGITLVKGFNRLIGIDTARAKLSALGHDADKVESIMTNALEAVKGTSFGMDEAATAAASAVAAGIKPGKELTKYLSTMGDAAAIAGADFNEMASIFNKVQTAQRAYTGDLNMLADRGIPIYQWLAEEAGTSAEAIRDMASDGEVSAEMFRTAIEKNIGGAAKTIGEKSFAAAWKNIGADISRIGANFLDAGGKAGGFFSTVKPMLTDFRGYLSTLEDKAADFGVKFGKAFQRTVDTIKRLKAGYDSLHPSIQKFIKAVALFGTVFLIMLGPILKFIGFIPALIEGFIALKTGILALKAGMAAVGTSIGAISWPITLAVAAIVGAAFLIIKYWKPIKKFFVNLWRDISKAFMNGFNAIDKATNGWLRNGLAVYKAWAKTGLDIFKRTWRLITDSFSNALAYLKALITLDFAGMRKAASSQFDLLKDYFGDVWSIIKRNMTKPLKDLTNSIRKTFTDVYDWINQKTGGFFGEFINVTKLYFKTFVGIFKAGWEFTKSTFSNALKFLKGLVKMDFGLMAEAARDQMDAAKKFISEAWDAIKDNIGKKIAEIGRNIKAKLPEWRDALLDWIKDMPSKIGAQMEIWNKKIKEKLEIIRDSFVDKLSEWQGKIETWFEDLPDNIAKKMESWNNAIRTKLEEFKETFVTKTTEWQESILGWFESMPDNIIETLEGWRDAIVTWTEKQDEENREQFEAWGDTIRGWFESVPEEISTWFEGWKTRIVEWFEETKEDISTKLDSWKEVILSWFQKRPGEIYNELTTWWTKMGKWYDDTKTHIKEKLDGWWTTIKSWFTEVPDKPEIKNAGKNMIDKLSEGNEDKKDDFITKLGRLIIDVVKAAIVLAAVAIFAVGREIIRGLIRGITDEEGFLRRTLTNMGSTITKVFREVDLFAIGKDIIRGLINGVGSMASSLWQKATSLAKGIGERIAGALGVKSPSRVAYNIAKWVPIAMVNAFSDYTKHVNSASDKLAEAATPNVSREIDLSYATPSGIRSSLAGAVSGTVDVNASSGNALLAEIRDELRRQKQMIVEMDGREVGKLVEPHVTEKQALDARIKKYF